MRHLSDETQTFLEIANDSPYPIRLAGTLNVSGTAPIDDLGRNLRLSPVTEKAGRSLVLDLLPYGVKAIRIGAPHVQLSGVTPYPSEPVLTTMQSRFNELSAQLARLNHGLAVAPVGPTNPGFEPGTRAETNTPTESNVINPVTTKSSTTPGHASALESRPEGWQVDTRTPGAISIAIDCEHSHAGKGSLKLTAPAVPASVVSDPFVPVYQSTLDIQVFVRATKARSKLRVWIEGESAGQPYVRRTELDVAANWELRTVRASDIPPGGLDTARIRFELMTPGELWIDDLQIRGETTSRSARLNAQRTLLAALQAYREQRYADFARLASSHWIRHASPIASGRIARTIDSPAEESSRTKR